jgi:hypothetical protein
MPKKRLLSVKHSTDNFNGFRPDPSRWTLPLNVMIIIKSSTPSHEIDACVLKSLEIRALLTASKIQRMWGEGLNCCTFLFSMILKRSDFWIVFYGLHCL